MQVGDIVIPKRAAHYTEQFILHCGSGTYKFAIVASVKPFALVSEFGDMMWTATVKPEMFDVLCQAHPDVVAVAVKRFKSGY